MDLRMFYLHYQFLNYYRKMKIHMIGSFFNVYKQQKSSFIPLFCYNSSKIYGYFSSLTQPALQMARTFDVSMLRLIVLYFQSQYGVDFVKSDKSNKIQTFYLFHKSHNGAPLCAPGFLTPMFIFFTYSVIPQIKTNTLSMVREIIY